MGHFSAVVCPYLGCTMPIVKNHQSMISRDAVFRRVTCKVLFCAQELRIRSTVFTWVMWALRVIVGSCSCCHCLFSAGSKNWKGELWSEPSFSRSFALLAMYRTGTLLMEIHSCNYDWFSIISASLLDNKAVTLRKTQILLYDRGLNLGKHPL